MMQTPRVEYSCLVMGFHCVGDLHVSIQGVRAVFTRLLAYSRDSFYEQPPKRVLFFSPPFFHPLSFSFHFLTKESSGNEGHRRR